MQAEQKIERAHVIIMSNPELSLYSRLIMMGTTRVDDTVPTAYTDGLNKVYGRAFVDDCTMPELVGTIIHEASHILFSHAWLWLHLWKKDAKRANKAADYVINIVIDDLAQRINVGKEIIRLPTGALLDKKYRGMDTQEVFDLLGKENDQSPDADFDQHDFKDDMTPEEREMMQQEVEAAVREGRLHMGRMGGGGHQSIDAVLQPQVSWEDMMRSFAYEHAKGNDSNNWSRPNRRHLQHDVIMPSKRSERIRSMAIINDTSGSIDKELVSLFLGNARCICETLEPQTLHLICWDAKLQSHDVYQPDNYDALLNRREFAGGGGTDMAKAVQYVEENIDADLVLVLTDGYTPWPTEVKKPTFWGITTKGKTAPVGVSVHVY